MSILSSSGTSALHAVTRSTLSSGSLHRTAPSNDIHGLRRRLKNHFGSLRAAFKAFDDSGAGHLTLESFRRGCAKLGEDQNVEMAFNALDSEGLGMVTLRSWILAADGDLCSDDASALSSNYGNTTDFVSLGRLENLVEGLMKRVTKLEDDYTSGSMQWPMMKEQNAVAVCSQERAFKLLDEECDGRFGEIPSAIDTLKAQLSRTTSVQDKLEQNVKDLNGLYGHIDVERTRWSREFEELRNVVIGLQTLKIPKSVHQEEMNNSQLEILHKEIESLRSDTRSAKADMAQQLKLLEERCSKRVASPETMSSGPCVSTGGRDDVCSDPAQTMHTELKALRAERRLAIDEERQHSVEHVQNAVAECRTVASVALSTVKSELEQRCAEFSKLGSRLTTIEARLAIEETERRSVIAEVQTELRDQVSTLQNNSSLCAAVSSEVVRFQSSLHELQNHLDSTLMSANAIVRSEVLEYKHELDFKFSQSEKITQDIEMEMEKLDLRVSEGLTRRAVLDEMVSSQLDTTLAKVGSLGANFDALEERWKDEESEIKTGHALKALEHRFVVLEDRITRKEEGEWSFQAIGDNAKIYGQEFQRDWRMVTAEIRSEFAEKVSGLESKLASVQILTENEVRCAFSQHYEHRLAAVEKDVQSIQTRFCSLERSAEKDVKSMRPHNRSPERSTAFEPKLAALEEQIEDCCASVPLECEQRLATIEQDIKTIISGSSSQDFQKVQATMRRDIDALHVSLDKESEELHEQLGFVSNNLEAGLLTLIEKFDASLLHKSSSSSPLEGFVMPRSGAASLHSTSLQDDVLRMEVVPESDVKDAKSQISVERTTSSGILPNDTETTSPDVPTLPTEVAQQLTLTQQTIEQLAETCKSSWSSCCAHSSQDTRGFIGALQALREENMLLREQKVRSEEQAAATSLAAAQMMLSQENIHLREQRARNMDVVATTGVTRLSSAAMGVSRVVHPPQQAQSKVQQPAPRVCVSPTPPAGRVVRTTAGSASVQTSPQMQSRSGSCGPGQHRVVHRESDLSPQRPRVQSRVVDSRTSPLQSSRAIPATSVRGPGHPVSNKRSAPMIPRYPSFTKL